MVDPVSTGTGLAVLGAAYGGAQLVEKLLGPTAGYIGEGLQRWTQKRVENVGRIFQKAHEKLGDKIKEPGTVPPRVLKEVLDDGSYCDDELVAEYYGGVLASSRTKNDRDDRGSTYLRLTAQLSTYQIRFHYALYYWWRKIFLGTGLRPTVKTDLQKMVIFLPYSIWQLSMGLSDNSLQSNADIIFHCANGLKRKALIEPIVSSTTKEYINKTCKKNKWRCVSDGGMIVEPEHFGIEYWLWATGNGNTSPRQFLLNTIGLETIPIIGLSADPFPLNSDYPFNQK